MLVIRHYLTLATGGGGAYFILVNSLPQPGGGEGVPSHEIHCKGGGRANTPPP